MGHPPPPRIDKPMTSSAWPIVYRYQRNERSLKIFSLLLAILLFASILWLIPAALYPI
jgi:hypothetical protein